MCAHANSPRIYSLCMQKSKYTTAMHSVIALSLAILALGQLSAYLNIQDVYAAASIRQNWEYKRITIENFHSEKVDLPLGMTGYEAVFEAKWYEDGTLQNGEPNMTNIYSRLGTQGWELVATVPRSEYVTPKQGVAQDVNGSTSDVIYIFKRPKN